VLFLGWFEAPVPTVGCHGGIRASDSAVAGYKIFRNGTQIATSTTDLLCRSLGRPKYELSLPSGGV
jgi:hypothetical protein